MAATSFVRQTRIPASPSRSPARRGELVRVLAELAPVAHRLLEVVADERVVAGAVAVEPRRRALVQVGAVGLRQARVGGVAEEDVVEGVAVVAGVGSRGGVDEAGA